MTGYQRISVVIPTLNEALELPETLRRLKAVPEVLEILVSDGGSRDATCSLAEESGCRVIHGERGRGAQLRRGAAQAIGAVVWMVHADTWVEPEAGLALLHSLESPHVVGGGFWKVFRDPHWLMRGSRWRCWTRLHFFNRIAADQAIFVRREVLEKIGGVPPQPLMEEFELCRRLSQHGRLTLAKGVVQTSARRWHQHGVIRTYLKMWRITMAYTMGMSPNRLAKIYDR
jgi:rSAM/selenodomain-associated transferase 2